MRAQLFDNHNCALEYIMFLISHARHISANNGGRIWDWSQPPARLIHDTVKLECTLTNKLLKILALWLYLAYCYRDKTTDTE